MQYIDTDDEEMTGVIKTKRCSHSSNKDFIYKVKNATNMKTKIRVLITSSTGTKIFKSRNLFFFCSKQCKYKYVTVRVRVLFCCGRLVSHHGYRLPTCLVPGSKMIGFGSYKRNCRKCLKSQIHKHLHYESNTLDSKCKSGSKNDLIFFVHTVNSFSSPPD